MAIQTGDEMPGTKLDEGQGMATALWAFFAAIGTGRIQGSSLAGLLGFCGWLPFAQQMEDVLSETTIVDSVCIRQVQRVVSRFLLDDVTRHEVSQDKEPVDAVILSTPVFLSHGADDAWVPVELGRQAARVVRKLMAHVKWNEFTGAERDGHWITEPDGVDQILQFLERPATS